MEVIRRARASDLEALTTLVREVQGASAWTRAGLEEAMASAGARTRLVVNERDRPLGYVLARRMVDVLEIDLVGVAPAARRRGLARRLLEDLLAEECDAGLGEARLELSAENPAAFGLYRSLGFVVVGRRARYYPGGEDAVLLSWWAEPGTATSGA